MGKKGKKLHKEKKIMKINNYKKKPKEKIIKKNQIKKKI